MINVSSSIRKTSERLGADILVVPSGIRGAAEDVLLENKARPFYMYKAIIERVKGIKGIDVVTPPNISYNPYRAMLGCTGDGCCNL